MFITDFRKEFYDKLLTGRVLLLVHQDVDAVCACRILIRLFESDHIQYTLVPVSTRSNIITSFREHRSITNIVLLNCGASIDILDEIKPRSDIKIFISDSHRPVDLVNVFNASQIYLVMRQGDELNIPDYDDVFWDSDNDTVGDDDSDTFEPPSKKLKPEQKALLQRSRRRKWEEKRKQIIFDYEEFAYSGTSTAFTMFEISWKLSRDCNDLLWWAIVGLTDQFLSDKIEKAKYLTDVDKIQPHVSRLNHRSDYDDLSMSVECLKISLCQELNLELYRHWSLYESIRHSAVIACYLKSWTNKGSKKLLEMMADMGLPLHECKQKFANMDSKLKNSVPQAVTSTCQKFGIMNVTFTSFVAQHGFKNKFCASDYCLALNALLENADSQWEPENCFLKALDTLSKSNAGVLYKGIEMAKLQSSAIVHVVQTMIDMHQIMSAGPFLFAFIQEGIPDWRIIGHPHCIKKFATFLQAAHVSSTRSKRASSLPLVVSCPLDPENGICMVTGIPPVSEASPRNLFGKAFHQAAAKSQARLNAKYFDSSIVELRLEDRTKFMDCLIALLMV